jgi:hypothetical protein
MAAFNDLRNAFNNRFKANWNATDQNKVVYGANRAKLKAEQGAPWVRLAHNILNGNNAQVGIGFQRYKGILTLQIFCHPLDGDKVWSDLADAFAAIFQNKSFNGVVCYVAIPVHVGQKDEEYQVNVKIDFEYEVYT